MNRQQAKQYLQTYGRNLFKDGVPENSLHWVGSEDIIPSCLCFTQASNSLRGACCVGRLYWRIYNFSEQWQVKQAFAQLPLLISNRCQRSDFGYIIEGFWRATTSLPQATL